MCYVVFSGCPRRFRSAPVAPRPWGKGSTVIAPRAQSYPQRLDEGPRPGSIGLTLAPPYRRTAWLALSVTKETGGATLEVAVTPGPYRRHHHRCATNRPPPLALAAHGHRPGLPGQPRRRSPGPSLVPLFRPLEANPETGLLPPRYHYALSGNFFKKSVWINSGISQPPRQREPGQKISNQKIRPEPALPKAI